MVSRISSYSVPVPSVADGRGVVGVVHPLGDIDDRECPIRRPGCPARNRRCAASITDVRNSLYGTYGAGPSHMSQSKPGGTGSGTSCGCASAAARRRDGDGLELADAARCAPVRRRSGNMKLERCCAPELEYHAGLLHHVAHGLGVLPGEGARLLVIHVLAVPRRRDSDEGSPALARRHQQGIDILALQQLAEIVIRAQDLSPLRASTSALAACRAVSCTSQMATTRMSSCCRKPRMSPVPCLPTPMQPSVIRSLGAARPRGPVPTPE